MRLRVIAAAGVRFASFLLIEADREPDMACLDSWACSLSAVGAGTPLVLSHGGTKPRSHEGMVAGGTAACSNYVRYSQD